MAACRTAAGQRPRRGPWQGRGSTSSPRPESFDLVLALARLAGRGKRQTDLARTSLEYSFLQGRSLWRDRDSYEVVPECARDRLGDPHPGPRCARFLASSAKAAAEWKQEDAFHSFESTFGARPPRNESRTANALVEAAG
ncbi:hypothetical protein [Streptomyces sp. NPDC020681]|uniref:hypothetical protein n=1 Tax=Streptomyces sp. NPDC020681 TaxID=3365083 RepID=UPI0037B2E57E